MAYQAGGTDYSGMLRQRAQADEGLTSALKAKGEREKADRVAASKKRSTGQKLISAAARGAAAYYTGGLSETMGGGEMIDKAMMGSDAEANEYGGLVKAGSAVYQGGLAQKGAKLAQQDARMDKLMDRRSKNVSDLFAAGDLKGGKKAQQELEMMETDYLSKRKGLEAEKNPFSLSQKDYDIGPKFMSRAQTQAEIDRRNRGGGPAPSSRGDLGDTGAYKEPTKLKTGLNTGQEEMVDRVQKTPDASAVSAVPSIRPTESGIDYGSRKGFSPPKADAHAGPDISKLVDRNIGAGNRSDQRAIDSWMRNTNTLTPDPETGETVKVTGKWGKEWEERKRKEEEKKRNILGAGGGQVWQQ